MDEQLKALQDLTLAPSLWMCSTTCPCPSLDEYAYNNQPWFFNYFPEYRTFNDGGNHYESEALANKYGRTVLNATGYKNFSFASGFQSYFSSFIDCYNRRNLSTKFPSLNPNLVNIVNEIETANDCSGLCTTGLFHFSKNVVDGPPSKSCSISLFSSSLSMAPLPLGIVLILPFCLLSLAVTVTLLLNCFKKD